MHKIWAGARLTLWAGLMAGVMAGCGPQPGLRQEPGALAELHFLYDRTPERLFTIAADVCSDPAQRVTRPAQDIVECRSLLPPANTAAAILAFDGTITDLPETVIRFAGAPGSTPYLVRATVYLEVPREGRAPVQVQMDDPAVWQRLAGILTATGGQPAP